MTTTRMFVECEPPYKADGLTTYLFSDCFFHVGADGGVIHHDLGDPRRLIDNESIRRNEEETCENGF